jgi:hypothetical protein
MGKNDAAERRVKIPSARHFGHVEVAWLAGELSLRPRGRCDFC